MFGDGLATIGEAYVHLICATLDEIDATAARRFPSPDEGRALKQRWPEQYGMAALRALPAAEHLAADGSAAQRQTPSAVLASSAPGDVLSAVDMDALARRTRVAKATFAAGQEMRFMTPGDMPGVVDTYRPAGDAGAMTGPEGPAVEA